MYISFEEMNLANAPKQYIISCIVGVNFQMTNDNTCSKDDIIYLIEGKKGHE